jgi:hypothetical protein
LAIAKKIPRLLFNVQRKFLRDVPDVQGTDKLRVPQKYTYKDGDGTTAYDVEYPLQIHGFDPNFHFVGMTFNPEAFADTAFLNQPDGNAVYSWGYGCNGSPTAFAPPAISGARCPTMRVPGPTQIVTE